MYSNRFKGIITTVVRVRGEVERNIEWQWYKYNYIVKTNMRNSKY